MARLRVQHRYEMRVHEPVGGVTGMVELITDVDYATISDEDRKFVEWLTTKFEQQVEKKNDGTIPR